MSYSKSQRFLSEALGTAFLLAAVVGSGIMADKLAGGNVALALLCNPLPTGAILVVFITMLGPIAVAHFNPAVTLAVNLRGEIETGEAASFDAAQIVGALAALGVCRLLVPSRADQPAVSNKPTFSEPST